MERRFAAFALALAAVLTAPSTFAGVPIGVALGPDDYAPYFQSLPSATCMRLVVDARAGPAHQTTERLVPLACFGRSPIESRWNVTVGEANGFLRLNATQLASMQPSVAEPDPVTHPRLTTAGLALSLLFGTARADQPTTISPGRMSPDDVFVEARFTLTWGEECSDSRGFLDLNIGGTSIVTEPSWSQTSCRAARGALADVDPAAFAQAAAAILQSAQPNAPHVDLETPIRGLLALAALPPAPSLESDAQTRAAASEPAESEARAGARVDDVGVSVDDEQGVRVFTAPAWYPPSVDATPASQRAAVRPSVSPPSELREGAPYGTAPAPLAGPSAPPSGAEPRPASVLQPPPAQAIASQPPIVPEAPPAVTRLAVATAGGAVLALAAAVLYQRLAKPDALRHAGRAALHAALLERPGGATVGELGNAAGIPRKTAEYHLLYMLRLGLVSAHDAPGEPRRYLPPTGRAVPTADDSLVALARAKPGLTTAELADLAGMTRSRADRRAKDLVMRGQLEARPIDGERRWFAMGEI